ncbi:homeobox transcription factor [Aspergillus arachidicola]|uniref:Homeobox transcription factor n=1 Tax=Aspergillus arachidicola TaxID=656916 RepID=A0A2G7FGT8_9EURO|nr:homeobox transcription factor [Aspergillus arachidicola]
MNYLHHPYAYAGHAAVPMEQPIAYDPTMAHPSMMHPMDGYIYPHPPFDMIDFYHQPIMDYEEYAENLSRPRLTKEQVETLEAQFQAHPKPSSNVKRQLAAQTNLSLPRVANWFQNRRAKAKQQKRQEEFERMQKAKTEAEEAARIKIENAEKSESNPDVKEETDKDTPKQSSDQTMSDDRTKTPASNSRSKHHKTKSESAREATFASLQRALNAAVAAREHYSPDEQGQPATIHEGSVSPTTTYSGMNNHGDSRAAQSSSTTPFSEWENAKETAMSWSASQSPQEHLGYSAAESLTVPELDGSHHQNAQHNDTLQFHSSQNEEWSGQVQGTKSFPSYHSSNDAEASYSAAQYTLHPESSLSRRGSSDDLADSLEGIGIHAAGLPIRTDRSSWKEAGKELDLAARRKRPRPAAIGTSRSSSMLAGSSASMSPTTRLPSYGSAPGVRQSKSAQCLNSRYAGVRKASAAQRSPLNLSSFAEAGTLGTSKPEMPSMLSPAVTTGGLAPPTPLTPDDLHHFIPNTPSDGGYCLSAQPTSQLFPTTQPMQINIASPPATPLAMDMLSTYQYHSVAPPMSAPAHYTSFPDYVTCEGGPLTGRSWTGANSMPSPEAAFQNRVPITQADVSSLSYGQALEQGRQPADSLSAAGSPPLMYTTDADMHTSSGSFHGDAKPTEFYIHEFPEQQEAHRFVAQQLPQKPKAYTFNNQTPSDWRGN